MGPGNFVLLIKKPTSCMPVVPMQTMESVYESGYFESVEPVQSTTPPTNVSEADTIAKTPTIDPEIKENTDSVPRKYCEVHGCDVTDKIAVNSAGCTEPCVSEAVPKSVFPDAATVCETNTDSKLQDFNLLEENELNLEFPMTNQNYKRS